MEDSGQQDYAKLRVLSHQGAEFESLERGCHCQRASELTIGARVEDGRSKLGFG